MHQVLVEALKLAVSEALTPDPSRTGLLLSGGLDSAVIQAIARLEHLYCITWPEQDNISVAKLAARGFPVTEVTFTREEMLDVLPEIHRLTHGTGSWSQVCQWFAARRAKEDGIEVLLTGECADELFGGYTRYRILHHLDKIFSDYRLVAYQGIVRHVLGFESPRDAAARMLARTVSLEQAFALIDQHASHATSSVEMARLVDLHHGLPPLLENETACLQAFGAEARYPFGHPAVRETAARFFPDERVTTEYCKAPLRNAARHLGVLDMIVEEQTKKGLAIPQVWRPEGVPLWSTKWFVDLLKTAAGSSQAVSLKHTPQ